MNRQKIFFLLSSNPNGVSTNSLRPVISIIIVIMLASLLSVGCNSINRSDSEANQYNSQNKLPRLEDQLAEKSDILYFEMDELKAFSDLKIDYIEIIDSKSEYNILKDSDVNTRISPCSTFKIVNSLIALEEGIVSQEDNMKKWNGKNYSIDLWNKDQTMETAFKNSVVWYYQDIARQIGSSAMSLYLEEIEYGNLDISEGIDKFWLASSLIISPKEQVDLLDAIFIDNKYFSRDNIKYVENLMYIGDFDGVKVYGKTGSSKEPSIGWFVGFYEYSGYRNTFAIHICSKLDKADASGGVAKEVALSIISSRFKDK